MARSDWLVNESWMSTWLRPTGVYCPVWNALASKGRTGASGAVRGDCPTFDLKEKTA
jgi:hypothetical protein